MLELQTTRAPGSGHCGAGVVFWWWAAASPFALDDFQSYALKWEGRTALVEK